MSKVTIKKVFSNIKETKFGPKMSIGLKVEETTVSDINGEDIEIKDRFINSWFPKDFTFPFQEGDIVNVLITSRGDYLDFKLPENATSGDMSITSRVLRLETQMKGLLDSEKTVDEYHKAVEEAVKVDPTEPVVDPSDNF